jgi:predicted Zn-dependent protease
MTKKETTNPTTTDEETAPMATMEPCAKAPKAVVQDEYAELKHDLKRVTEKGKEALDEATPGREIQAARLRMQSRYGTIVQTGSDGVPQGQFCCRRRNRKGEEQIQRYFIGLACEVDTKGKSHKSEDVAKTKRVVNDFEATLPAAPLFQKTVHEAQKAGDGIQRKVDEENYEYFPPFPSAPVQASLVTVSSPTPVDVLGGLFAQIEEVIDRKLGAKLDRCDILAYHINDCMNITASDGTSVDVVNPMFALNVKVKTKDGNTAFGAIRGSGGGLEVLKRNHPEKGYEEIVASMAEKLAKDAIDMDRAQGASILGTECPVIFGSHAAAVLIHECYGHSMESDIIASNRRSKSAKVSLKGRIGAQVSDHPALTIFDTGERDVELGGRTFQYCWGSIPCDDHGQEPKRTLLVDKGIQVGVMSSEDTLNEILDGLKEDVAERIRKHGLSGNMRAEKYDLEPQVRMRTTYLVPDPKGPRTVEAMAALVPKNKKGVYMHRCAGGWVNPDTGDFCVEGDLCYLIENGLVTDKPVKAVKVTGNLSKFGNEIKAIGHVDTIGDTFPGFCGKENQYVAVQGIAPAVYVENAKLGGGSFFSFDDVMDKYLRQVEEVQRGTRDTIYLHEVEEVSGIRDQAGLLMVCEALPGGEEVRWITGKRDFADFTFENGELRDRKVGL